jgi:uncharacterized membrane protein
MVAWGLFRGLGMLGVAPLDSWPGALRHAYALMFVFTGIAHFTRMRADMIRMVPRSLPRPDILVTLTGLLEFAGAIGLVWNRTARPAAFALALLLLAMFPANVFAARAGLTIAGRPATPLVPRTLLQIGWMAGLVWVALTAP